MTERRYIWRMALFALGAGLIWALLGLRLAWLHLGNSAELEARARSMHRTERTLLVGRGRIFDASGTLLATDLMARDICLNPPVVRESGHAEFIASRLAHILDQEPSFIMNRIMNPPGPEFAYAGRFVDPITAERIERMKLPGVFTRGVYARFYPHGSLMSHVIGFSNREGVGSAGIEQHMDHHLRGRPGLRHSARDARRHEIYGKRSLDLPAQEGADVYLTLDKNVQDIVEWQLEMAVHEQEALGAWAVVQEIRTGRILALASYPHFDLNEFNVANDLQKLNRAIGYTYEPGSTMKAAVFAAAFNEGLITPHDRYDCEDGIWYYRGRPLRDFRPYGILTVTEALHKSSNIATAKIALKLGEERLERYLREFGFGSRPGSELPGEERGIFAEHKNWDGLAITRIPIGHSISCTALHIASLYSTLANGGRRMRPYVVDRVVGAEGNIIHKTKPEVVATPVRPEVARLMSRLLLGVTEEGTARRAQIEGYSVAGKTGTTVKLVNGRYTTGRNVASFAGFLPVEDPEITVVIVIDEPKGRTGGMTAAPVFQKVGEQLVRYLDIPTHGRSHLYARDPATTGEQAGQEAEFEWQVDQAVSGLPRGV